MLIKTIHLVHLYIQSSAFYSLDIFHKKYQYVYKDYVHLNNLRKI